MIFQATWWYILATQIISSTKFIFKLTGKEGNLFIPVMDPLITITKPHHRGAKDHDFRLKASVT